MKITLLTVALCSSFALHAQQDPDAQTPPAAPAAATPPVAPLAPAQPAKPKPSGQNAAAAFVSLVEGKGDCRQGTTSVAIHNSSADKIIIAIVEMTVEFHGRVNVKDIRVDNLGGQETRSLGCKGCIPNTTGETCTKFRIKAVAFK